MKRACKSVWKMIDKEADTEKQLTKQRNRSSLLWRWAPVSLA